MSSFGSVSATGQKTLLILTQAYPPDPMSVGQHLADVAVEMVRRGHRVVVLTANRGYDDPTVVYPAREVQRGVEVRRLSCSSFGKRSLGRRIAAAGLFAMQCGLRGLSERELGCVLVSTVPPFGGTAALLPHWLRGVPIAYWVMDLNPEQLVALGKLRAGSPAARLLEETGRAILRNAAMVVTLDRFMARRLESKVDLKERLQIIPPWPHEEHLEAIPHEANPFRKAHGLEGKLVVMYSGNHSPSHPLGTILEAAARLRDDPGMVFLFVGGGQGKAEVEAFIARHRLPNARSLPYQALSEIRYSLSAADVHLVALGDAFVGINHPCKVYAAMAVARPVLYLGPSPSHVSDLLREHRMGWRVAQGDVEAMVRTLETIRQTPPEDLARLGLRAREALQGGMSQRILCARFCEGLERVMRGERGKVKR
jgi:colanic acid biosynthesis glycosyl transferase WcaI